MDNQADSTAPPSLNSLNTLNTINTLHTPHIVTSKASNPAAPASDLPLAPPAESVPNLLSPEWEAILRQTEREVVETLDLGQVLTYVIDIAVRATLADDAGVAIIRSATSYEFVQVAGEHYHLGIFPIPLDNGIIGRAIRTRQSIFTPDVSADPDYLPFVLATRAQMTLVIVWRDELIGALVLETDQYDRFTEAVYRFMLSFTERVALAIDNARAHEQLRRRVHELDALTERLRAVELLKSTLLDVAAHDLRNPVNAIHQLANILLHEDDLPPERVRLMLQAIVGSAGEAMRITEDLLLLRRVEKGGGGGATYRPLDLMALLRAVIDKKKPSAALRQQLLLSDLPDQAIMMLGEPTLLREMLSNLIDNAIKYTPDHGHITVIVDQETDSSVRIAIMDIGYGIVPDELSKIFDPFYRVQSAIDHGILGTGLGLHIVRQIVDQHSGTIAVSSTQGVGSTFSVTLPILLS